MWKGCSFWQSVGFEILTIEEWMKFSCWNCALQGSPLTFSLYDQQFVEEHTHQVNTNAPQIMFLQKILWSISKMQENQVEVGQLMQLDENRYIFNLSI